MRHFRARPECVSAISTGPLRLMACEAVRMCRAAHVTAYIMRRLECFLAGPGAVMPACVCLGIRRMADGSPRPIRGQYVEPRMPGHAQTAGHGPEPPLPVGICSVSHAVAYRVRTQAGTMIQAPTCPASRHASWPITPGEGIPARLRSRRPNLARCSGRSPKNSRIRPSAARLERLFGISRVRTCFREMFRFWRVTTVMVGSRKPRNINDVGIPRSCGLIHGVSTKSWICTTGGVFQRLF